MRSPTRRAWPGCCPRSGPCRPAGRWPRRQRAIPACPARGVGWAAIAGARWAEAAASIEVARESAGADAAQIDACAAQVAAGRGRLEEADRLARAALRAAEGSHGGQWVQPEVACEALEVIGRVARQRDLEAAERAFADRKSTRLNSSHSQISYAVFCLKKKKQI